MAVYRTVHISYWQDSFMLERTPEEKFFYIYLLTNSKTTQLGIYELPKKIIELETGYNHDTIEKLISKFEEYKKIQYSKRTNEVFLMNWIKHNPINNVNIFKCVSKEITEVKEKDFLGELCSILDGYTGQWLGKLDKNEREPIDFAEALKGLIRGLDAPWKKKEEEKEKEKEEEEEEEEPNFHLNSNEFKLSFLLFRKIKERDSNYKEPNLQKWSEQLDKLHRVDKREFPEIESVINWCQNNEFWQNNILSTDKLRKQFSKLYLQMKSEKPKDDISETAKPLKQNF